MIILITVNIVTIKRNVKGGKYMKYELNNLYNMDCMEAMKEIPDKYFELAIVDPPYGIKPTSNFGAKDTVRFSKKDVMWDIKPSNEYFEELMRVSKNQIIWGGNYFQLPPNRCFIIWDKENGNNPFADCEYAWTSFKNSARIFRMFWLGSHVHRIEEVIHPTQKPVALYKWLLTNYAKEGDKILDTHVGSASSLIACYVLGFDYMGFEIDEEYYNNAVKRLSSVDIKYYDKIKDEKKSAQKRLFR